MSRDIAIRAFEDYRAAHKAALSAYMAAIKRAVDTYTAVLRAEQPELPIEPDYPEEYQRVWRVWLHQGHGRGSKHGGYKAWRALSPPPTEAALLDGIAKCGSYWRATQTDERHIPHFETFCSTRRWESPPALPPALRPRPATPDVIKDYRQADTQAQNSWKYEWSQRWPAEPWPGLAEAMARIQNTDKGVA